MPTFRAFVWIALTIPLVVIAADSPKPDPWASIRFLVGRWEGTTHGEPGLGTVARSYEFVLSDRFIHECNTSTYPPQEKNEKGEVHEHWSFFSYDRLRKALVLRQFHTEGFVNQYVRNEAASSPAQIVFENEAFENLGSKWRAREIYDILGPDEFTETFQLAESDKPFQTYSKNHLKRVK